MSSLDQNLVNLLLKARGEASDECRKFTYCSLPIVGSSAAAAVSVKGVLPALASFGRDYSGNTSSTWIAGAFALPAAGFHIRLLSSNLNPPL